MVDFAARHEFDAAPSAVAHAMTDPAFVASLRLPDLEAPDVLGRQSNANGTVLLARFRFVGSLDPIARKVLGNDRISWVQEVEVDADAIHGRLRVTPDARAGAMRCEGSYRLDTTPNGGTARELHGELQIKIPLIGGRAERHILPGLLRRIDLEADALRAWLAG
jgi:hypothetical protein